MSKISTMVNPARQYCGQRECVRSRQINWNDSNPAIRSSRECYWHMIRQRPIASASAYSIKFRAQNMNDRYKFARAAANGHA